MRPACGPCSEVPPTKISLNKQPAHTHTPTRRKNQCTVTASLGTRGLVVFSYFAYVERPDAIPESMTDNVDRSSVESTAMPKTV